MKGFNPKRLNFPDNTIKKGKQVLITGNHVWSGCTGQVIGTMDTLVGHMYEVKLNNGRTVGAKGFNLKVING